MTTPAQRIADNLARVQDQIADAANQAGRSPNEITLVAVTKYVGVDEVNALIDAGCVRIGESRPQELWSKVQAIPDRQVEWHLVGHLQRNKIQRTLPLTHLIHSVDSPRLMIAIQQWAESVDRPTSLLIEVNISGDEAKHGFPPDQVQAAVEQAANSSHVQLRGLMCMAGLEGGLDRARADFAALRQLRDQLSASCPPNASLTELSMGMSRDFQVAIQEGTTIVRIGSTLFEGII